MSDTVRHLRLDGDHVHANIETARWIVPVTLDITNDPAAAAAVDVLRDRMRAAAIQQANARIGVTLGRIAQLRQRTTAILAGRPGPARPARRWAA